jgi:hypothetical protein
VSRETTLSLKAIAGRVRLGTSKSANAQLHAWMQKESVAKEAAKVGSVQKMKRMKKRMKKER